MTVVNVYLIILVATVLKAVLIAFVIGTMLVKASVVENEKNMGNDIDPLYSWFNY